MTTVIVPLDGTDHSETAIPHACRLAAGGPVVLLCATWLGEPPAPEDYLAGQARPLRDAGVTVETRVVEDRPSTAILDASDADPDALVCMTTHGRRALGRTLLGSTAEAVVRDARRPLVLVGEHATADRERADARALLVAVDTLEAAAALAPVAVDVADRLGLTLHAFESVPPAPFPFAADDETARDEARALVELERQVRDRGATAVVTATLAADPVGAIVEHAAELPASLVLMGTHARHGAARIVLGSTAMGVVRRSPAPVMLVRL